MHPFPVRQGLHLNFFEFRLSKTLAFKTRQRENEFYFCMGIKNHFHINGFSSPKKKETWGSGRSNLPIIVPEAFSSTVI